VEIYLHSSIRPHVYLKPQSSYVERSTFITCCADPSVRVLTLGSWVRILLDARMSASFCVVLSCAMGRRLVQGVVPKCPEGSTVSGTGQRAQTYHWLIHEPVLPITEKQKRQGAINKSMKHGFHAMKTYWGRKGIAPRIFHLSTWWKWVVSSTPRLYRWIGGLGGPHSRSGRCDEKLKKKIPPLPLPGTEPRSSSP
jgi:hypothetical protein